MSNKHMIIKKSLTNYLEKNKDKIDTALVSLRILKQIDDFIEKRNLTQKDLANKLDVSEAFISQLMTGSKKINVSLINKFEKGFNVEFEFKIKNDNVYYRGVDTTDNTLQLQTTNLNVYKIDSSKIYSLNLSGIMDVEFTEI